MIVDSIPERSVFTFLNDPVATPLARLRRMFFSNTANIVTQSHIDVGNRLGRPSKPLQEGSRPHERMRIVKEARHIFRSGLNGCLEALVMVSTDHFGKLVKTAISHPEWIIEDPAEWGRCRMAELLDEQFSPGPSGLSTVGWWFRVVCDEQSFEDESSVTGFAQPWRAPVWCSRHFSTRWWQKHGFPERLPPDMTEKLIRVEQQMWRERLNNEIDYATDKAGIDLEVKKADRLLTPPSRRRVPSGKSSVLQSKGFVASLDYRTIRFRGKQHKLTRNQSEIVKLLHENYQCGTPAVGKDCLLSAIDADTSRVRDSFRNSPLWGTLVITNRKPRGTYQLNLK